ncbi:MAG TPA: hypothetical protein VG944_14520, partial [Fimbriimonas sp.]|nr:hypothetical protein [Fimbriimonas sp.]
MIYPNQNGFRVATNVWLIRISVEAMIAPFILSALMRPSVASPDPRQAEERTVFQTHAPYEDRLDSRADVAIVYGFDKTMPDRVKSWRDR